MRWNIPAISMDDLFNSLRKALRKHWRLKSSLMMMSTFTPFRLDARGLNPFKPEKHFIKFSRPNVSLSLNQLWMPECTKTDWSQFVCHVFSVLIKRHHWSSHQVSSRKQKSNFHLRRRIGCHEVFSRFHIGFDLFDRILSSDAKTAEWWWIGKAFDRSPSQWLGCPNAFWGQTNLQTIP